MPLGCAFAMLLLLDPVWPAVEPQTARSAGRARALAMFARAYYPGRSGQIALVPKEGEFITRRETDFMHGSPWDYDVGIPFLLWSPGRVRKGAFGAPVAQQDIAPTLARMLGVVLPSATRRPLDDFRNPLELSQKPLMRLLGSREKRHHVFEGGHVPPRQLEVVLETLDWLDRYLGPIG